MTQVSIGDDITLTIPASVEVRQSSGGRRSRGLEAAGDPLNQALADAEFEIAAEIELVPGSVRRGRGRDSLATEEAVEPELTISVGPDESAVLLMENSGGVFAWVTPPDEAPAGRRGRGGTLTFVLVRGQDDQARGTVLRGRRGVVGWLGQRLIEPIRIRVLKFAVGAAIDFAVEKLEGSLTFGLVDMSGPAASWKPGAPLPAMPSGRPARILLMVHGTFSTTLGSFASLELNDEGRAFLEQARTYYDAVIGFDHSTLAEDPSTNARAIAGALAALPPGSVADAVAYSRGGLVLRELAEQIAPDNVTFRKMVFVGCTNAGTHLAEPDNWKDMIDLYTNIVIAGSRALSLLGGGVAGQVISVSVSTLGRFVKMLSQVAVGERRVPGLAAMEPGGEVVTRLNGAAETDASVRYHVIASNFQPRIEPEKGLTGELAEYLLNRIADRLFKVDNDLVVDTASMSDFGSRSARLQPDRMVIFPAADVVYHTIYFAAPKLGQLLRQWLDDPVAGGLPSATRRVPRMRGGLESFAPSPAPAPPPPAPSPQSEVPVATGGPGPSPRRSRGPSFAPGGVPRPSATRPPTAEPASRAEPPAGRRSRGEPKSAAPETVAEALPALCHFAAEMAPTPELNSPTPLFVTVSPDRILVAGGPASATTAEGVAVEANEKIEIEIMPGRNCRVVGDDGEAASGGEERPEGPSLKRIDVPTDKAVSLRFLIEGFGPGVAEIFIEARQRQRTLASFLLKPTFTESDGARLTASQTARPTYIVEDEPAVLRILEMQQANGSLKLRFDLACENPRFFVQQDVELRPNFDLAAFVGSFLTRLDEAYDLADYDGTLARIRDFSIVSTNDLIPERVRRTLWKFKEEIKAIQVISENPIIPWELLYVVDPSRNDKKYGGFLAEWGLVRWMYNATWPKRTIPLRQDRVFYVIPDYLDPGNVLAGAQDEKAMLLGKWPAAQAIEATSNGVRGFLEAGAGGCDLVHFACHGEAKQQAVLSSDLVMRGIQGSDGKIRDDLLGQESVKINAAFGTEAPSGMIFINACQTGRPGEGIAGVMGFADAFIRPMSEQGVGAFIGALWSVDDKLALTFADTLYDRMLAGDSLVVAAREARKACQDKRDFTWLAYSIYGNPFATADVSP